MKPAPLKQGRVPTLQHKFFITNRLIFLLLALFLIVFIPSASLQAQQKFKGGPSQWQSVGGKRIFSADHEFKNLWVLGRKKGEMDMYWKNHESRKSAASHPFATEVRNDVLVKKGTIVVTGPGFLARDMRIGGGCSFFLKRPDKSNWHQQDLGVSAKYKVGGKWTHSWERRSATPVDDIYKPWAGGIPEGETVTLEAWVSRAFVNMPHVGRGYGEGLAGGDIWWFPKKGGKLVSVTAHGSDGPDSPHHPPDDPDTPPVVTTGNDQYPIADSHVYAYSYRNWNQCNWGAYDKLGAGHNPTGGDKRTYLKFDVSKLSIPAGKRVKLRLFHYHTGGSATAKLAVYPVTSAWKEGRGTYHSGSIEQVAAPGEISWLRQPKIARTPVATFHPGAGANKFVEVDVTDLVKSWKSGQANHGMVIMPISTEGGGSRESVYGFLSREYEDANKRPALIIGSSGNSNGSDLPPPPPPTGKLQIRVDHKQIQKGQTFHLPVWLDFPKTFPRTRDGRINIANLNVEIQYNPNVIRPGSTTLKGNILGNALFQANSRQAGVIKLGFAAKKGIMVSGTLAQLAFQAIGQPGQRSPVSVRVTTVNDDKGRSPKVKVVHGYVEILNKAVIGDINGNGIIDAGDALSALKMSVGLIPQDLILNIDQKDQVTSNDARLLLKKAVQGGGTAPRATTPAKTSSNQQTLPDVAPVTSADARRAYQEYIAAYNKMTSLMAKGQGDTPAAQQAHKAYKAAKDKYEAALNKQPAVK